MDWLRALLPALVAAAVTMAVTPAVARLAVRVRAVDVPGGRKQHEGWTPRLGGIAIVIGIVIALGPSLLLLSRKTLRGLSSTEVVWFTFAVLIIFALGLVDDIVGLGPFKKLLIQVLAATIVVAIGWQFTAVRLPLERSFELAALGPLLSIVWVVGVTNAINFIDGLDGLAAGVVAIIAISLLLLGFLVRSPETVIVSSAVAGACLGFLRHNWRPARIYMGDSGALTLGFVLASISLRTSVKASAAVAILVPILALGLPVIDTLMVMWYRFLRGQPRMNRIARMFHADRKHLHHLLLETGRQRSRVMMILYGLAVVFCLMALAVAASASWRLGMAFLAVEFAAVLLIRRAGLVAEARQLADRRLSGIEQPADSAAPAGQESADGSAAESDRLIRPSA